MKDLEALNVHHRFGGQKCLQGSIDTVHHHNARRDCKMRIIMVPRVSTIYLPDVITQPNLPCLPPRPCVFAYCKQSNTGGGNGLGLG